MRVLVANRFSEVILFIVLLKFAFELLNSLDNSPKLATSNSVKCYHLDEGVIHDYIRLCNELARLRGRWVGKLKGKNKGIFERESLLILVHFSATSLMKGAIYD